MAQKPKKKSAAKAEKKSAAELPEWMDGTPTMIYSLEAFYGTDHQTISMSLTEFEALKIHLCKLRGYEVPAEAAHV